MQRQVLPALCILLCFSATCLGQRTRGRAAHGRPLGFEPRLPLAMTLPEQQMLADYLNQCKFYFEFGCGGSTALASDLGVPKIVSVDSYMHWVEKVRNATSSRSAHVSVNHVDIGEVGFWGFPRSAASRDKWPSYAEFIRTVDGKPDLVLVDGRFRISCFMNSLLVADASTVILIHDFWPRTATYRAVFDVANVVDGIDSFAVFRKKAGVTDAAIQLLLDRYKYDSQ